MMKLEKKTKRIKNIINRQKKKGSDTRAWLGRPIYLGLKSPSIWSYSSGPHVWTKLIF